MIMEKKYFQKNKLWLQFKIYYAKFQKITFFQIFVFLVLNKLEQSNIKFKIFLVIYNEILFY